MSDLEKCIEVLKEFKFYPDCGGDFCDEVLMQVEPDYAFCSHFGYCCWAYKYSEKVEKVLAQVEGV